MKVNQRPNPEFTSSGLVVADGGLQPARRSARRSSVFVDRLGSEQGAATAEYAVATMAAVGFAGLLVVILRGDEVRGILIDLIRRALSVG
jgi:hypothetical protein